jgi:2-polyprenyl-3-methyl-5-hydroxy-6-metoxy-1,4-benzoquinol methylase
MYEYIANLYNTSSGWEQLKDVPGTSDYPRAKITKQIFKEYLDSRRGKTEALEIGPGSGFITEHLSQVLPSDGSCSLDLMDFSDGFLKNTGQKQFKIRNYICFDVTRYQRDFAIDLKYDFIFFQEVLEHLVSPFIALVNINNMLRDGGLLFLTIPNSGWWRNLYMENLRYERFLLPKAYMDTHLNELSTTGLVKLVTMAGFDVIRIEYYCSESPVFKPLFSEQVGLLLVKRDDPANRWVELTDKLREQYKLLLEKNSQTIKDGNN